MTWRFEAVQPDGGAEELGDATDRTITFNLTDYCSAEFSINGRSEHAGFLHELITDVRAYRDGTLMYRGRVGATSDDLDASTHSMKVSTADYRWLLSKRTLWPTSTLTYAAADQSDIAWDLIADSQALSGGSWGITRGSGTTTGVDRDRTYEVGSNLAELLNNLAAVDDGFDYEVDPFKAFNIYYPSRGELRDFAVTYSASGGGNCSKISRALDPSNYADAVRVSGADAVGPVTRVAADIATRPEGRFEQQLSFTNLTTDDAVAEAADAQLDLYAGLTATYTVTLQRGYWDPSVLWLGDTCPVQIRSGRLDINDVLRVYAITVAIGDDGDEVPTITFGPPIAGLKQRLRGFARRIDDLERR